MNSRIAPWLLKDDQILRIRHHHIPRRTGRRQRLLLTPSARTVTSPPAADVEKSFPWAYARELFGKSSLNGISHIAQSNSWIRRIVWAVLFVLCMGGFIYQAGTYFYLYFAYPTNVEVKVENKGSLEFPGMNSIDLDPEKMARLDKQVQIALGHNKTGLFVNCGLQGRDIIQGEDCVRHFHLFFIPDHGNCYTFNVAWNSKGEKIFHAYESDIWNLPTVLMLDLNVESEDYMDQYVSPAILVSLHAPDAYPDPEVGRIKALPGNLYNIGLKKSTTVLLPSPYQTNCTEYKDLPWTKRYSGNLHPKMCTLECSKTAQIESCECVSANLTRLSEDAACDTDKGARCAEMVEEATKEHCRTLCRVPCERTVYEVTVDSTIWPKPNERGDLGRWSNRTINDIRRNLLRTKIYLRTMEHTKYEHLPKYLLVEVFSHLGGYLSLWLGLSVLTMWEFFENSALIAKATWLSNSGSFKPPLASNTQNDNNNYQSGGGPMTGANVTVHTAATNVNFRERKTTYSRATSTTGLHQRLRDV